MACGLTNGELFILHVLYSKRCFKQSSGYNSEKLKKIFIKATYTQNFDDAIKNLENGGYITPIRKKDTKFYISDFKLMAYALTSHGFPVTQGRIRSL